MPVIFCKTNVGEGLEDYYGAARLALSEPVAHRLLRYRDLLAAPAAHDDQFYALEFFDYEVDFGAFGAVLGAPTVDDEDTDDAWFHLDARRTLVEAPTGSSTMLVTAAGVYWCGTPEHTGGEFETAKLTWEELTAVAAGADPWAGSESPGSDSAVPPVTE